MDDRFEYLMAQENRVLEQLSRNREWRRFIAAEDRRRQEVKAQLREEEEARRKAEEAHQAEADARRAKLEARLAKKEALLKEKEAQQKEEEYRQACEDFHRIEEAARQRKREQRARSRMEVRKRSKKRPVWTSPELIREEDESITRFTPARGDVIIYTQPQSVMGERLRFDVFRRGRIPSDELDQLSDNEYWQHTLIPEFPDG